MTTAMLTEAFASLPLLEVLKHPLAAARHTLGDYRHLVRRLEMLVLRGPRPAPGVAGLRAALEASDSSDAPTDAPIKDFLAWLEEAVAPFTTLMQQETWSFPNLIHAHMAFAEALATSADQPGAERLWRHDAAIAAAGFVTDLLEGAEALPQMAPRFSSRLFQSFMEEGTMRPSYGRHPRLLLWRPLEARLQQPDLFLLGGLNEGPWPPALATDPWMSRPTRLRFVLTPL